MADSDVTVRDNTEQSRFEAWVGEELGGVVEYELREGVIDFVHTEVDDDLEGEGVGSTLAREALDAVRRDGGLRVVASCPFVKGWIERHPDYRDLLA